jgi:hypothetical protein
MKTTLGYRISEEDYAKLYEESKGRGLSPIIAKKIEEIVTKDSPIRSRKAKTKTTTLSMEIELALKLKNFCEKFDLSVAEVLDYAIQDLTTAHTEEI